MSLKVDDLPPRTSELLYRAGLVSCASILETAKSVHLSLGNFTEAEVEQIYSVAAKQVQPTEFIPGATLAVGSGPKWGRLTSGCPVLDQLLGGGVATRGITEVAGHSGCGKTQLCLQLSLTAQLPGAEGGLDAGAVFICTEDRFPSVRLNQLLSTYPAAKRFSNIKFGNNIFVEHISDATELQQCVKVRLPQLMSQHRIGLVVIDSVAAVFRADYTQTETVQRAKDMRALASQLHSLANTHHAAVVCVNQVSDAQRGNHSVAVPALGLAWANLVTCRLQMFRHDTLSRQLHVVCSPDLPPGHCYYNITAAGVHGKPPIIRP